MWKGEVLSIHITPQRSEPMRAVEEVRAVAGKGLEGDRYFLETGTYSKKAGPHRQVTLIESEVIEALKRDHGIDLDPNDSRRNIVVRRVPLAHLVGETFRVGQATLHGVRINQPCKYFEGLVRKEGILDALLNRSGLNAEILKDGVIRRGDEVEELTP